MYDHNAVEIYTDGSAIPNPGSGGLGIVIEFPESYDKENKEISEGYYLTTNNRMELLACVRALEWLGSQAPIMKFTRVIIITDSEYVYKWNSIAQYWKDNKWMNNDGKPYENADLWDTFLKERQKIRIPNEIRWEKGKTRPSLLRVDALAKQGAKNPTKDDYGFRVGKFTTARTASKKAATLFLADNQQKIIRIYRKILCGKIHDGIYKVYFDEYSIDKKDFIGKYIAYWKGGGSEIKRNNCYEVLFNNNPRFPEITNSEHFEYPKKDR